MISLTLLLRLNASSCLGFGFLFLFVPTATADFLSADNPAPAYVFAVLGAGLILNGLHLIWASLKTRPDKALINHFSTGDFIWVIATLTLIIFDIWITTFTGIVTALLVAAMVGLFGVLQLHAEKQTRTQEK